MGDRLFKIESLQELNMKLIVLSSLSLLVIGVGCKSRTFSDVGSINSEKAENVLYPDEGSKALVWKDEDARLHFESCMKELEKEVCRKQG